MPITFLNGSNEVEPPHVGSAPKIFARFRDENDALYDPTTVSCDLQLPGGVITTYVYLTDSELVKDAVGVYYLQVTMTQSGKHHIDWIGTTPASGKYDFFEVEYNEMRG